MSNDNETPGARASGLVEALRALDPAMVFDCDRDDLMKIAAEHDSELLALHAEVRDMRTALDSDRLISEGLRAEIERLNDKLHAQKHIADANHRTFETDCKERISYSDRADRAEERAQTLETALRDYLEVLKRIQAGGFGNLHAAQAKIEALAADTPPPATPTGRGTAGQEGAPWPSDRGID